MEIPRPRTEIGRNNVTYIVQWWKGEYHHPEREFMRPGALYQFGGVDSKFRCYSVG